MAIGKEHELKILKFLAHPVVSAGLNLELKMVAIFLQRGENCSLIWLNAILGRPAVQYFS